MFFTRVVEIDDITLPPKPSHSRDVPRFGQPSFNVPIPPDMLHRRKNSAGCGRDTLTRKRRQDEDADYESDEAEVNGLVRVTVVTRRKKIKVFHVPTSESLSALAPTREDIGSLKAASSQVRKMHPTSHPRLQIDNTGTSQDQAYPPPMTGLGKGRSGENSSWLGVNDYSFLPYQSLMAQREAENPTHMDWPDTDEHFIFQGSRPLNRCK